MSTLINISMVDALYKFFDVPPYESSLDKSYQSLLSFRFFLEEPDSDPFADDTVS